jgi:hypothetical protein
MPLLNPRPSALFSSQGSSENSCPAWISRSLRNITEGIPKGTQCEVYRTPLPQCAWYRVARTENLLISSFSLKRQKEQALATVENFLLNLLKPTLNKDNWLRILKEEEKVTGESSDTGVEL